MCRRISWPGGVHNVGRVAHARFSRTCVVAAEPRHESRPRTPPRPPPLPHRLRERQANDRNERSALDLLI
jgi:hypothetical protein